MVLVLKSGYNNLMNEGKPSKILCFTDEDANNLPELVKEYLNIGVNLDLPNRYKCKKRKNWYVIPNIAHVPEGFFFKRSHHYPKLLKNSAGVLVTDSGYKIEMRKGHDINHFIYSFYNSLTLAFSELTGRYYGGGVLELTPQEFKKLPIPNVKISGRDFNTFTQEFENKENITQILKVNDAPILNSALNLGTEEINRVRRIYATLVSKRMRNNTRT